MNKMKVFNFSIVLVISMMASILTSYGQFGGVPIGQSRQVKVEDAKMVKERTLLVVRVNNPDFDHKFEEIVNNYWKFNKSIAFVAQENVSQLLKGNEEKYCVLTLQDILLIEDSKGVIRKIEFLRFSLSLGEKAEKKKPLFYQNIAFKEDDKVHVFKKDKDYVLDLDKKEILFALDYIQNHLIARAEGKNRSTLYLEAFENTGKLATKTLLIAKQDMDEKLTEQDIKEYYPYPYKIVDAMEIQKAYLLRSKEFAFVEIAPFGHPRAGMLHYVVNCEDAHILSIGEVFNGFGDRFSNLVNKGHLRAYVKFSNRKVKSQ